MRIRVNGEMGPPGVCAVALLVASTADWPYFVYVLLRILIVHGIRLSCYQEIYGTQHSMGMGIRCSCSPLQSSDASAHGKVRLAGR